MTNNLSRAAVFAESSGTRSLGAPPDGWHKITSATHPLLFEAMDAITHDGGGGCHNHYNIPPGWVSALDRAESLLGRMSPEQCQIIAIGDQSEQDDLAREFDAILVHRLLGAFFEDFIDRESIETAQTAGDDR